jgi:hypothetical protein
MLRDETDGILRAWCNLLEADANSGGWMMSKWQWLAWYMELSANSLANALFAESLVEWMHNIVIQSGIETVAAMFVFLITRNLCLWLCLIDRRGWWKLEVMRTGRDYLLGPIIGPSLPSFGVMGRAKFH